MSLYLYLNFNKVVFLLVGNIGRKKLMKKEVFKGMIVF